MGNFKLLEATFLMEDFATRHKGKLGGGFKYFSGWGFEPWGSWVIKLGTSKLGNDFLDGGFKYFSCSPLFEYLGKMNPF